MKLVLGVDGGATKTLAVVGDTQGRVLGVGLGGPSNYQPIGMSQAMENLRQATQGALDLAGAQIGHIRSAIFGLAGADFPIDFEDLDDNIAWLFPGLLFQIVNDTWVGFRAGTSADFGGVVVAGSGANFAALAPDGTKVTGRGMGYEWGSEGGAGSLIRQAMHRAFRSNDGTGQKTGLQEAVLQCLGFSDYDSLSLFMYKNQAEFGKMYTQAASIVPALFQLALGGDPVSQEILIHTGEQMGDIIGNMMFSIGLGDLPADVVLCGSIFTKGVSPLMISSMATACQRHVPYAAFQRTQMEPAGGAYLMALEALGIDTKPSRPMTATTLGEKMAELPGQG